MAKSASRWMFAVGSALALSAASMGAYAAPSSGLALDRFEPTPAGDPFFGVASANVHGRLQTNGVLIFDYAHAPLVLRYRETNNGAEVGKIVSHQLYLHLAASLALFRRVLLSIDAPIALLNEGGSPHTPSGTALTSPTDATSGDLRLGARARVYGEEGAPFQLAVGASLFAPTGNRDGYTGDGRARFSPAAIASGRVGSLLWSATLGAMFRQGSHVLDNAVTNELLFGAAAGFLASKDRVLIGPEIYGSTELGEGASAFGKHSTNAELLVDVKYRPDPIVIGVAAGPGLTTGVGTPDWRLVFVVGYAPWREPAREPSLSPKASSRERGGVLEASGAGVARDSGGDSSGDSSGDSTWQGGKP